jgi:hypothetical protein
LHKTKKELWKILKVKINKCNDDCPLEYDDATDKINRASDGNEYKFKLFENHLVEIRKNNPHSVSALNDFLVRD